MELPSELDRHTRSCWDMASRCRILLACQAASDGLELEPCVLSGFDCTAERLADEGWDLDAALLYIEDYRSAGGKGSLGG